MSESHTPASTPAPNPAVMEARDLLVVSYHFPPIQSPGVYRVLGLVKYLRRLGWRITVLTVQRSTNEAVDDASLSVIPEGVRVIRTQAPEPVAHLQRMAGTAVSQAALTEEDAPEPSAAPVRRSWLRRLVSRPGRALVDALMYPDYHIHWAPHVAREVRAFVRTHPGAVVFSSTPPHSAQIGVRMARARTRFVWVSDFRDPWTAPLRQPKGRANLAVQHALERWVLAGVDQVIANTEGNRAALLESFPRLDPERVSVVTNAFDNAATPAAASTDEPALACDIVYFGEIYPGMFDGYLAALRVLVARDPAAAPRLHVFGIMSETDTRRVEEAGLTRYVSFLGMVSYERSLALMRASPSLLLLLPAGDAMATCIPSKVFPYLFSGRRILAFVPPGDAARVLEQTGAGEVVSTTDPAAGAERLAAFVARVRRGDAPPPLADARIAPYAMERIASRVHDILRRAHG